MQLLFQRDLLNMKKIIFLFLLVCGYSVFAELRMNPDENTLWQLSSLDQKKWKGTGVKIENRADGFTLSNENSSPKAPHSISGKVPVNPEYPYLVFETTAISPFKGYRSWSVSLREFQSGFGSVTNAEPGIAVVNCFENPAKLPAGGQANILFYFYDFKADFKYVKMVKKPDNYIAVTGNFTAKKAIHPGDKVKFTVYLKESAEEVSLKLLFRKWLYTVKVNGNEVVELIPEDKDQKIWSAEIPVTSLKCSKGNSFKKGEILLRAVVLGGSVKVPLWSSLQYPFVNTK